MSKNKQVMVSVFRGRIFDEETLQSGKKETCKGELKLDLKIALLRMGRILNGLAILAIRIYQNTLGFMLPPSCRFDPSCSQYAMGAFRKFGLIKGGWLSVKRLSRCHPFNPGGFDPLP